MFEAFFKAIDKAWKPMGGEPITLNIIGSTALFLQCEYDRGTKDADVLEVHDTPAEVYKRLKKIAGKETSIARRHKVYIDTVVSGLPFLPHPPQYHPLDQMNQSFNNFGIQVLDIIDVVVSKLKRFSSDDVRDIRGVINLGLVPHETLVQRFKSAQEMWELGSRATDLPKIVANLHMVERDYLDVTESVIQLPDWIEA